MATFKPLSQFNVFFKLAHERTLCGTDQLIGLHIQNKFNLAHWAETITVEDAEFLKLIRWYDKTGSPTTIDTIRNAKARLKKKGFIDFKNVGKTTEYRLVKLYSDSDPSATLHQPFGDPSSKRSVSYTPNVKKEDLKIEDRDDASACEADVAEATKPQVSNTPAKSLSTPKNGEDIHEVWQRTFGFELRGDQALTLEQLAAKDYARVEFAIRRTKEMEAKRPFAYFKTVYNDCDFKAQEPKTQPQTSDAFSADNLAEIRRQMELAGIPYPAE